MTFQKRTNKYSVDNFVIVEEEFKICEFYVG